PQPPRRLHPLRRPPDAVVQFPRELEADPVTTRPSFSDGAIRRKVLLIEVTQMLSSFKTSVEASEVGAFDGWRGRARVPADTPLTSQPWDAIDGLACLEIDWPLFKTRLARFGEEEVVCRCGAHFLSAFLVRHRWTLIVLGRQSLVTPATELLPIRTTTLATLA